MLNRKPLFVVGAGGSADFKFPLGFQLAAAICGLMPTASRQETEFAYRLFQGADAGARNEMFFAAQHIKHNLPLAASIDSYLDTHRDNAARVKVAKSAIAHLISQAENKSSLSCKHDGDAQQFDFSRVKDTWLQALWAKLHVGVHASESSQIFHNLKIATFNYDRCIEQFLRLAVCNFFDCNIGAASELVEALDVLHVYGSLGPLNPSISASSAFVPNSEIQIGPAIETIKTFTEPVSEAASKLVELILDADQIVFVGFSFGGPNLGLIEGALPKEQIQRRVYGTVFDMDEDRVELVREWTDRVFSRNEALCRLRNCKGEALINKFSSAW